MRSLYLLDTNIISELTKPTGNENVLINIESHAEFSAICAPVWYEIMKGWEELPSGKRKDDMFYAIEKFVHSKFEILPFDESAAALNADIYAKMKSNGTPRPIMDTQIASIALANNMILVTRNVKDYEPIAEHFSLCLENWFE